MRSALRLGPRLVAEVTSAVALAGLALLLASRALLGADAARSDARERTLRAAHARAVQARDAEARAHHHAITAALARELAARPADVPWDRALRAALDALPNPSRPRVAEVLTPSGTVLAAASGGPAGNGCGTLVLPSPVGAARLVATYDLVCDAVALPPDDAPGAGRALLMLAQLLLPALAAGLAAALAARRVVPRVRLLAMAAERVGNGDLTARVRPRGDDELDELMRTFNRMVEEMRVTRERVEYLQRVEAWQDFARRLAHEIKNPLTPIQLAVQEAARKYSGDDARYRRTLDTAREVVEEEVATLRRLVTAFSDFARLPEVKPAPGDLAEFVRDMASARELLDGAEPSGARVVFAPGDAPIPVRIDRVMLKRAFENLVRNAVQAIGARGGTVWVRAEQRRVEVPSGDGATTDAVDQAWLVVEDDGPGIPAEKRAEVFVPYYTTKAEGTGLGLAIVRKIALDHDGDVGCDERPGGGARFVIALPLSDPARRPRWSFVTFSR